MDHGFFTRGHMDDPEIEAEVRFLVEFGINSEITTLIWESGVMVVNLNPSWKHDEKSELDLRCNKYFLSQVARAMNLTVAFLNRHFGK